MICPYPNLPLSNRSLLVRKLPAYATPPTGAGYRQIYGVKCLIKIFFAPETNFDFRQNYDFLSIYKQLLLYKVILIWSIKRDCFISFSKRCDIYPQE